MKMNKDIPVDIYWFSGTGNTLVIAREMAEYLESQGFSAELKAIERSNPENIDMDRTIGLALAVAEQGTYPLVWDFLQGLPDISGSGKKTGVFLVDTLMIYSGGIKGPVKKIISKKGYIPLGAKEIKMPNSLMKMKYRPEKERALVLKGRETAREFSQKLIAGESSWWDIPLYSDLMGSFSRMKSTWKTLRNAVPLKVDNSTCTRCRLCERLCPTGSWSYDRTLNEMSWLPESCMMCLRCFSYCPSESIKCGRKEYLRNKAVSASAFSAGKFSS